jgi:hypothetical protein
VRRVLLISLVVTCLALVGCSNDNTANPSSDPPSDPTNAIVELGRPVERGYDRTDWDPAALEAATALARRATATSVGCVNPGPVAFEQVKSSYELVKLPMPGAVVQCFSNGEDEDLQFSAFPDEESKATFVESKAELICARAMAPESDTAVTTRFDGIVYVDAGNVIIEPDTYVVRDQLAAELQATPTKMCADAVGDRPPTSAAP